MIDIKTTLETGGDGSLYLFDGKGPIKLENIFTN